MILKVSQLSKKTRAGLIIDAIALNIFATIEKPNNELFGLQILRGLAASLVVFHHSLEESLYSRATPLSPDFLTTFGASGVDVFFIISGFIMLYVSFPADRPVATPSSFLLKRASRVYPFYWICLLTTLALWSAGLFRSLEPDAIIRDILLAPSERPTIGVSWTLVFEVYFYLLFAVTLFLRSRILSWALTTSFILGLLMASSLLPPGPLRSLMANPIVIEFCFGMSLAYLFISKRLSGSWPLFALPFAFSLIIFAPLFIAHDNTNGLPPLSRLFVWGCPAALILVGFLKVKKSQSRIWSALYLLGDASYAIYLTHPFVMIAYARLLRASSTLAALPQLPLFVPIVLSISLTLGVAAHIMVERPLTRVIRHGLYFGGLRDRI